MMRKIHKIAFILAICTLAIFTTGSKSFAQVKKPVSISTAFIPPYSLYLDEYVAPGSQKCMVNLLFNDYNETSWDVYLHMTIESSNLKITTKENFRPASPITLYTGENLTLKGDDLFPVFNYNNLTFAGISKPEIEKSGRLPEGFYTFTFEVRDYRTGKPLSDKSIFVANFSLKDPPNIILPQQGAVIKPSETQNITFQWQTNRLVPGQVNYKIHLYELMDSSDNPQTAILNQSALKIFESDEISIPTYQYSIADPLLENGKQYAFYIQAIDIEGKDVFKNNGYSEIGWFNYGFPQNGNINIIFPENEHGLTLREDKVFKWDAPDNLTNQQLYNYQMRVVKIENEENPEEGIQKDPYYEVNTEPVLFNYTWFAYFDTAYFATGQKFAWQVKAYTDQTEIAKSKVNTFYGPPFLEFFRAGNHKVTVTKTTSNSFENLSGEGTIKFTKDGIKHKVYFENIRVERSGAEIFLREGRCVAKCEIPKMELNPVDKENGKAFFVTDSVLLDRYNLKVKGNIVWDLPHPVLSNEKAKVVSDTVALKYNEFKLLGSANINKETKYRLLSPMNFDLILQKQSYISVKDDNYTFHYFGNIQLPKNIKGSENDIVTVPFTDQQQLYYIEMNNQLLQNKIRLVNNTQMFLGPQHYFIDLSEQESPGKKAGNPLWKGVYFSTYSLNYNENVDDKKQLYCQGNIEHILNNDDKQEYKSFVNSEGLQFFTDYAFTDEDIGYFNTFPSKLKHLRLDIENTTVKDGVFNGAIKIPVIDHEKDFTYYVPITNEGFNEGFLDEDLTGKTFTYNEEGGEQKMIITINRAVFQNKSWLDMNIDLDWPFTGVKMESLNHFRIWGNYQIGFVKPKGTASLVVQKQGLVNDFKITMDYIGCGREQDLYAIGTSADIIMGEDIAGKGGAPKANLYSISKNPLLSKTHGYGTGEQYINQKITDSGSNVLGEGGFDLSKKNDLENLDSLVTAIDQQLRDNEEALKERVGSKTSSIVNAFTVAFNKVEENALNLQSSNTYQPDYSLEVDKDPANVTKEDILLIIDAIEIFLNDEQKAKVQELRNFINTVPQEYIAEIYLQLKNLDGFIKKVLKGKVDEYIQRLSGKITAETNKAKDEIVGYIDTKRDSLINVFTRPVGRIIDSIGAVAADAAKDISEKIDFEAVVITVKNSAKDAILDEIAASISQSVADNLTGPITAFVDTSVNNRITGLIDSTLSSVGYALIDDQSLDAVDGDKIFDQAKDLIPSIVDDFKDTFIGKNGKLILKRITGLLEESVTNYDWGNVTDKMIENLIKESAKAVAKTVVVEKVTDFIDDKIGEGATSQIVGNIANNVELDFDNVGEKLKNGEIDKIIKFDPSYIKVKTNIAIFEGFVNFTNNDPIWGDSWQAELKATITIEPEFEVFAKYVNGTSSYNAEEEYKYWFLQLGVTGLNIPLGTLPLSLYGATGKVYHHMAKTAPDSDEYLPDVNTRFGVGLQVDFVDANSSGKVLLFNVGLEVAILQNGFIFEMNGDVYVYNTIEKMKVKESLVFATGYLMYNSVEKHFLANLTALIEFKPLVCAGGEMNIDISKENWRVAIGTREEPFYLDLFCMGSPFIQSWFDVDKKRLDAGLIVKIDINAEAPWIGPKLCKVKPWARLFFEMGTTALIYWNPFEIGEAHVWIDIYVGVGVKTKCVKEKNMEIAAVSIGGDLLFTTIPETTLSGSAYGKIAILGMSIGFNLEVETKF